MRALTQTDMGRFADTLRALPARRGRTEQEQKGGIAASLARARALAPGDVGVSART